MDRSIEVKLLQKDNEIQALREQMGQLQHMLESYKDGVKEQSQLEVAAVGKFWRSLAEEMRATGKDWREIMKESMHIRDLVLILNRLRKASFAVEPISILILQSTNLVR